MAELWDIVAAFSLPVKLAWAIWLTSGLGLVVAYRWMHAADHAKEPVATVAPPRPIAVPAPALRAVPSPPPAEPEPAEEEPAAAPEIVEAEATGTVHAPPREERSGRRRRRSPVAPIPA